MNHGGVRFASPAPNNFSDLVQVLDLILTTVRCDPGKWTEYFSNSGIIGLGFGLRRVR